MRILAYCTLILCYLVAPQVFGQIPNDGDAILYTSPDSSFQLVAEAQQVAGADIELLGFHVEPRTKKISYLTDTTRFKFYVPKSSILSVKLRTEQFISSFRRLTGKWTAGRSHCLKVPTASLRYKLLSDPTVFAFGEGTQGQGRMLIPISWESDGPGSLTQYAFWFLPNMDIEVSFSVLQLNNDGQWNRVFRRQRRDFFPGGAKFKLNWDGRINGQYAPDGIYQLHLEGYRYANARRLDLVRSFIFYHKARYGSCIGK